MFTSEVFPEPDLPLSVLTANEVEKARASIPELPDARKQRLTSQYGLPHQAADVLTRSRGLADYYEAVAGQANNPKCTGFLCAAWARKAQEHH